MTVRLPTCVNCGACCSYSPDWVEVTEEDAQRLPPELIEPSNPDWWIDWSPDDGSAPRPPFVMRSVWHRNRMQCIALVGDIGIDAKCSVYQIRPTVCRTFERGGHECCWFLGRHDLGRPW